MIVEQTHKSLIHGVSEQHPNQRIEGQLSQMLNMHPDAVTGLRRRRGFKVHSCIGVLRDGVAISDIPAGSIPKTRVMYKEFSGAGYVLAHDCARGQLYVYGVHGHPIGSVQNEYLVGEPEDFRDAVVSGFLGVLNLKRIPEEKVKPTYVDQSLYPAGFLYAFAGDTDYNFGVTISDYAWGTDGHEVTLRGTVYYMTFETGSGTNSKIGKWVCKVHNYEFKETFDPNVEGAQQKAKSKLETIQQRVATGSLKLADGGTEHSGNIPNSGNWYGHKLSDAFGVTATGLIMAVEQVMIQDFAKTFWEHYTIDVHGSSLGVKYRSPPFLKGLDIRTTASSKNLVASGNWVTGMQVGSKEQLPPRLPSILNGYVVGTGASYEGRVYWRYVANNQSWEEGVENSRETELKNMPVMLSCTADPDAFQRYIQSITNPSINVNFSSWEVKLNTEPFKGRTVGNTKNNPTPDFVGQHLTGIAGYQGRLVLLSGNEVYLSRSNHYNEFMRSTVQQVAPSDPIALQNLNLGGSEFRYAVEYNRDLVLISPTTQAVIPYNNGLSPSNAAMHFSSRTSINPNVTPIHSGRELLYCTTNSQGCVQVGRFVPDGNSEHQFTPELMTLHIPTYYTTGVRSWDANSLSGMVVLCNSSNELLVQFSTYQGTELLQNAWGKWVLPYVVHAVWFVLDTLYCVVRVDDVLWVLSLPTTRGYENYPLLDFWRPFDKALNGSLVAQQDRDKAVLVKSKDLHNLAEVALHYKAGVPELEVEWVPHKDSIIVGQPYRSEFEFTPPVLRKEQYIYQAENASARWIASYVQVRDSGAFKYRVGTPYSDPKDYSVTVSPQGYLGYGTPVGSLEVALHVNSVLLGTTLSVYTEGLQDLNAIGATSAVKFGARRRHWR